LLNRIVGLIFVANAKLMPAAWNIVFAGAATL
jgi:hypothetical protein